MNFDQICNLTDLYIIWVCGLGEGGAGLILMNLKFKHHSHSRLLTNGLSVTHLLHGCMDFDQICIDILRTNKILVILIPFVRSQEVLEC